MDILVGADPEVFVKDRHGRFRSAHKLIPGTKKEPFVVPKGAVQVDGMALEFNIDPASSEDEFVENIVTVMDELRHMIPNYYELVIEPTARFHGNHYRVQPEEALELGCEPDFNAYTGEENPRPDNRTTMRTAAGHIHLGFGEGFDPRSPEHMDRCCTLVKHLDAYLGLPSLMWDSDTKRRSMYGKAGAFRPKSYGLEYRTLSNRWLSDEQLMRYVYRQSVRAIEKLIEGERFEEDDYNLSRQYINSSRVHWAKARMKALEIDAPILKG